MKNKRKVSESDKRCNEAGVYYFSCLAYWSFGVFSSRGELWNEDEYRRGRNGKRFRRGLSKRVNFGDYMKLWRFKQIKDIIPMIMEDKELEDIDDWWKLKRG